MAVYREIPCASAFHKINSKYLPFSWDLNPYRGCEHRCRYCYALYSHAYLGSNSYHDEIYVKQNLPERLERQLRSPSWTGEIINVGGVTDSYQPIEAKRRVMPEILRLFIRYKNPCIISTKSALILRDYDLIEELSRLTYVGIASTITCMDEAVRERLEPGGTPSLKRVEVLREFAKTEASVGMHVMPIIPYLTDSQENLEALYAHAKECGASYLLPGILSLRGKTRGVFFEFIRREYPSLYGPITYLYETKGALKEYKPGLYRRIDPLKRKYRVPADYYKDIRRRLPEPEQLSLFPG